MQLLARRASLHKTVEIAYLSTDQTLTTHGVERSMFRLRAGGHDDNRPEAFLRQLGNLPGSPPELPGIFIWAAAKQQSRRTVEADGFALSPLDGALQVPTLENVPSEPVELAVRNSPLRSLGVASISQGDAQSDEGRLAHCCP